MLANKTIAGLFILCVLIDCVAAEPRRIVSINLCTDQYVLLLAKPDNIASITWLSRQEKSSYYYQRALTIPINHGEAEDIITFGPDLIVAGRFSARTTIHLLQRLGYKVKIFDHPHSLAQIRDQLRRMGELLERQELAERIINRMDKRWFELAAAPTISAPTLMQYAPGGYTVGRDSLVGDIIFHAGWRNPASSLGIRTLGIVDLETLLLLAPLALIDSPLAPGTYSFAEKMLQHPVLKKTSRPRIRVSVARKYWICGGPMVVDALATLREAREAIENNPRGQVP